MASPPSLATGLFTSVLAWALFFGYHYLVLLALDVSLTTEQMLLLTFGSLAMVPPSAPTLPGIFHAQIVIPFAALGFASSDLTAYSIVLFAFETLWIVAFGVLAMASSGSLYSISLRTRRLIPAPAEAHSEIGD
jgi:hypothetical protein